MTATAPETSGRHTHRVSVIGVIGEILITLGVIVLLFLGWQLWFNDIVIGHVEHDQSVAQSQTWTKADAPSRPGDPDVVPVAAPANAKRFGMLIVPRFGSGYYRPIAQGTGVSDVLNQGELGHYPTTPMPGAVGNFAIASHRKAYGGNLEHINDLKVGDHIYVETRQGWYEYTFRNIEYVQPTGVGVLDPVPQDQTATASQRIITLTSCNPFFSTAERIVAYGLFDGFTPRDPSAPAGGAPAEIAKTVEGHA